MTFKCVAVKWPYPMPLAGTWKLYSGSAMSQVTRIVVTSATCLYFKCPYQAIVMNVFDATRSSTTVSVIFMWGGVWEGRKPTRCHGWAFKKATRVPQFFG